VAGAAERGGQVAATGLWRRAGAQLGSPLALAVSVPCLVLALGGTATVTSYASLCAAGRARARASLHAQSERLKSSFDRSLQGGDRLLDRLSVHMTTVTGSSDAEALLVPLADLSVDRTGLSWMSVSFPDGTFVGTRRDAPGKMFGQLSRAGVEVEYDLNADRAPRELARKPTTYDPRARMFYRTAAAAGRRVWTKPYPFLPTLHTGITRAEPVLRAGALLAVLTIDFDVSALSILLDQMILPGERLAVIADRGSLLAAAGVRLPDGKGLSAERPLQVADVGDPVLDATAQARSGLLSEGARAIEVDGQSYHAQAIALTTLGAIPIALLSAVSEDELYATANAQARRAAAITGVGTLVALLLVLLVSMHVGRLRRARERAESALVRAQDEARRLGSYELCERLGAGGMGDVYRARHVLLARDAALKLMKPDVASGDPKLREAFFEEAKRLSRMRSIHTVSVYDFGIASDGRYFLAMELLQGLDLEMLVREYGPQSPARVASILAQVCDSLAEAHAAGLLHQDIKPANVFLCRQAEALDLVKVLDFGISRLIEGKASSESREQAMGTPAFMSPEQILGEPVGPAADLYALGCMGYFLLSGALPYQGDSFEALSLAHVEAPIAELPRHVLDETPAALRQLLVRCLAKRPEHRPVSARVLAQALRQITFEPRRDFGDDKRREFWEAFDARFSGPTRAARASKDTQTMEPARVYTAARTANAAP